MMNRRFGLSASLLFTVFLQGCSSDPLEVVGEGGVGGSGSSGASGSPGSSGSVWPHPQSPGGPGCGLKSAAFCDTFDAPSPGGRGGDLDEAEWSVARVGAGTNTSQGQLEQWEAGVSTACGVVREDILPPDDFFICSTGGTDSRLVNAYNDGGGFQFQSMRPRRPFDFTDRVGTVAFDLDARARTPGGHGFWWNFMITEDPEPAPYQQAGTLQLFSRQGFGLEFLSGCNDEGTENSVTRAFKEEDYEIVREVMLPDRVCFPTEEGVLNHIEILVSDTSLEVRVSDPGAPDTIRTVFHIDASSAPDFFPLGFTRGYVHFQHTHYRAMTGTGDPNASYQWDNIGFDGPRYKTPRAYSAPDNDQRLMGAEFPAMNIGYLLYPAGIHLDAPDGATHRGPFVLSGVDPSGATGALLTMNASPFPGDASIGFRLNDGPWHDVPYYFGGAGEDSGAVRPIVLPVDVSELAPGDNKLDLRTSHAAGMVVSSIELTLQPD
jgi:hypothetical protein